MKKINTQKIGLSQLSCEIASQKQHHHDPDWMEKIISLVVQTKLLIEAALIFTFPYIFTVDTKKTSNQVLLRCPIKEKLERESTMKN